MLYFLIAFIQFLSMFLFDFPESIRKQKVFFCFQEDHWDSFRVLHVIMFYSKNFIQLHICFIQTSGLNPATMLKADPGTGAFL